MTCTFACRRTQHTARPGRVREHFATAHCQTGLLAHQPGHEQRLMSQPVPFSLRSRPAKVPSGFSCRGRSFAHIGHATFGLTSLYLLLMQMCAAIVDRFACCSIRSSRLDFLAAAWHHERGRLPEVKHPVCWFQIQPARLAAAGWGSSGRAAVCADHWGCWHRVSRWISSGISRSRAACRQGADARHAGHACDQPAVNCGALVFASTDRVLGCQLHRRSVPRYARVSPTGCR